MNLIKELSKKKYIRILFVLFILELVASHQLKSYYYYFFEFKMFDTIENNIQLSYFNETMNYILKNADKDDILVQNLMEPTNFLIRIIPCENEITKVLFLPSSYFNINLFGRNTIGCYYIETYFFNNEEVEKKMRELFNNTTHLEKKTKLLNSTYEIVVQMNENHYKWINFVKIINFKLIPKLFNIEHLIKINTQDPELLIWINKKTIFSWQTISLFIIKKSIRFYYTLKWILNK